MEFLFILVIIVWWLYRAFAVQSKQNAQKNPAETITPSAAKITKPKNAPKSASKSAPKHAASDAAVHEQKRAHMAQAAQWRAAKQQQDDAERLHAVHVDSCESKLESLRILYEAGILDREEYAQRVARTKEKHFQKEA